MAVNINRSRGSVEGRGMSSIFFWVGFFVSAFFSVFPSMKKVFPYASASALN